LLVGDQGRREHHSALALARLSISRRFVIALVRPIVMPARPNQNNNQGHEGNIKQVYPFTTHPYALVSVTGLVPLISEGDQ
jgi:hypothetical protein